MNLSSFCELCMKNLQETEKEKLPLLLLWVERQAAPNPLGDPVSSTSYGILRAEDVPERMLA